MKRLPARFPSGFYLPDRTEIVASDDRGAEGVRVVGVTPLSYDAVLDELVGPAQQSGWNIQDLETADGHAEASWTGHGYHGRWAIRASDRCASQVVFEVLARKQ